MPGMTGERRSGVALSQAILDAMAAQIAVLDRGGVIIAVNESWRRFAMENGIEPGKMGPHTDVGSNYLAVCQASGSAPAPDTDALVVCAGIRAVLDGRRSSFSHEYPCHAPGRQRWFDMSVTPLGTTDGGAVASHTDVTQRVVSQEQVRQNERDLSITLRSISDGVIATDIAGRVIRMNPSAERLTGWSVGEAIGRPLSDVSPVVHALTGEPVSSPVELVLQAGAALELGNDRTLLARNGQQYHISNHAAPMRDEADRIVGVVIVFSDVTDAYQARQSVEDMAAMLERTSVIAKVGGWELDLRTKHLHWSRETYRIHELDSAGPPSFASAIGYYAPEDQETLQAAVRASVKSGAPWDYTLPMVTASGRRIWVRGQGSAVMQGGKAVLLRGVVMDVTTQMESEQALVSSLREKEALLREVHHRVKNNLQVISSLLRLEGRRSQQQHGTRDAFMAMQDRIHAMALLHETLYRSGSYAAVDLATYLGQIAAQVFRTMQQDGKMVLLKLDLAPAWVAMEQAVPCGLLVNELVSNSLKHGFPDGRSGEVRVELQVLDQATKLQMRISDTGVGLLADFDARRMQSLGLQLASDLAGQLGGTLEMGPVPNAVFSVTFTPDAVPQSAGPA